MKLTVVDVETTGTHGSHDRIIEIGMIRIEDGEVVKTFSSLINPQTFISPFITQMTGIAQEELESAPSFEEISEDVLHLLSDSVFVAHNARFDYSFIKNELIRMGVDIDMKLLCTVKLSRLLYPQHRHHNLDAIIDRFQITCENRHRAFGDALATWEFFKQARELTDTAKFDETVRNIIKLPSLPQLLPKNQVSSLPHGPGVYFFYDSQGALLYIGKSTNIYKRVNSHFVSDHISPREMEMLSQLASIEHISTAGELSALILESSLIKEKRPIYNRQLRSTQEETYLIEKIDSHGYLSVTICHTLPDSISDFPRVRGVFKSTKLAKAALTEKADTFRLCKMVMGLESRSGACLAAQMGKCNGACEHKELPAAYNMRFVQAFSDSSLKPWPFHGPIAIHEYDTHTELRSELHFFQWRRLDENALLHSFDADLYRILRRFVMNPRNKKSITTLPFMR